MPQIRSLPQGHPGSVAPYRKPESFLYVSRKPEDISLKAVDFSFQLLYVDDYIKKKNGVLVESSRTGKVSSPQNLVVLHVAGNIRRPRE